jgi:hypothetical protein
MEVAVGRPIGVLGRLGLQLDRWSVPVPQNRAVFRGVGDREFGAPPTPRGHRG